MTGEDGQSANYPKLSAGPVGKHIRHIYQSRQDLFVAPGEYWADNLISKLHDGAESGHDHLKLSVYSAPNLSRPTFKEASSKVFTPTKVGASFGPSWATHWFRVKLTIPKNSKLLKKERLEFRWDANNEGLIWTEDGDPIHGLSGGGDVVEWILPDSFRDGKEHVFYIEMACNGMFGNDNMENKYFTLKTCDIVSVPLEARALYFDYCVIRDAARGFPQDSWESHRALQTCNSIMDTFYALEGTDECIPECRKIARTYTGNVDSADIYGDNSSGSAIVTAVGHCHIDTCWLWPWDETKRKVARSWSNQCDLMDRYPELRFCCSQAQQYKWLETLYPSLYNRVKGKIKEGKFQPIGGSWVEHDTILPSGESLIRQFLYGQRYFESRFGQRCKTFLLPDTFGYSSQLPQLCRLAGMTRFFTQKLSWNNINKFPHTTFNWVALDRSQVICHMAPSDTYNAEGNFEEVQRSVSQHKSMDQDSTSLLLFGKGDGGGGPSYRQIERLRRCRGISDKTGLLPRVKLGDSVDDFFTRLEKKVAEGTEFATWYGELYFEFHRGTYTTQAKNKRFNRQAEIILHDIEYLAAFASILDLAGGKKYIYPKEDIDGMWENVLLCQFHDCLPGTCIKMCYDDSDKVYAKIFSLGENVKKEALSALGISQHLKRGKPITLNVLPWKRKELIAMPSSNTGPQYGLVDGEMGVLDVVPLSSSHDVAVASIKELQDGVFELSNDQYIIRIQNGVITSLYDIAAAREVIPAGKKANQPVIFEDKPLNWQAWDVEVYHLATRKELHSCQTSISEKGPYRVSVVIQTKISERSWMKSTISLAATVLDQPSYVEIETEVEWHESFRFLKIEFPVDVVNSEASYETQFGIVRRPTHYNTSWDMAKFEVCCHKWADLSEAGYGVSIINDSKYGFATSGNMMRLSLLRAPKSPNANADMGHHNIRYAILPHIGPLGPKTIRTAFNFNNPMKLYSTSESRQVEQLLPLLRINGSDSLVLDTIKRGEDDNDISRGEFVIRPSRSLIVRVYDSLGGLSKAVLEWGTLPVRKAFKCNILEDDGDEMVIGDSGMTIEIRAFEVASYRLQL